jgi:thioredoxin 1
MKEVTDADEIKKLMKSKKPVAIFYYAAWCPHCKVMHEPWSEIEKDDNGKTEFVKVESEDVPSDLSIPQMNGYPHFVLIKDGKVTKAVGGEMSKDQLKAKLLGGLRGGRRRTRARKLRRTVRKISH